MSLYPALVRVFWVLSAIVLGACQGKIESSPAAASEHQARKEHTPKTGIRRLSRAEVVATLRQVTGYDATADIHVLPADSSPYDTDYSQQFASAALIEGQRALASRVAAAFVQNEQVREHILSCEPGSATDRSCFLQTVGKLALSLFRRSLKPEELEEYEAFAPATSEAEEFHSAISLVLRSMIQDPEFIYLIRDAASEDAALLSAPELAARLSYFLWGESPDTELVSHVDDLSLLQDETLKQQTQRLLADDRAAKRISRFHALWLGYESLPFDAATSKMLRDESDALITRVIFEEKRSWMDLFTFDKTFATPKLAAHYGLEHSGEGSEWVDYNKGRAGILSHGSVLSNGAKFGDTSPTLRGIFIRERLLCQTIPPPPPEANANVDEPPGGVDADACKYERYKLHATGGCAGCHSKTDPIGFGLEAYDTMGRVRSSEPGKPECAVHNTGSVDDLGEFSGPGELAQLVLAAGGMDRCAMTQLFRFAFGREEYDEDDGLIDELTRHFGASDYRFDQVLVELVMHPGFRKKRAE